MSDGTNKKSARILLMKMLFRSTVIWPDFGNWRIRKINAMEKRVLTFEGRVIADRNSGSRSLPGSKAALIMCLNWDHQRESCRLVKYSAARQRVRHGSVSLTNEQSPKLTGEESHNKPR